MKTISIYLDYKAGALYIKFKDDGIIAGAFEFEPMAEPPYCNTDWEEIKKLTAPEFRHGSPVDACVYVISYEGYSVPDMDIEDTLTSFSEMQELIHETVDEYEYYMEDTKSMTLKDLERARRYNEWFTRLVESDNAVMMASTETMHPDSLNHLIQVYNIQRKCPEELAMEGKPFRVYAISMIRKEINKAKKIREKYGNR